MLRFLRITVILLALAPLAIGCGAQVGDECEVQTDCGAGLICEQSLPGGYCTLTDCERDGCPEEGVCIRFATNVSYCMLQCDSSDDCRDGYRCVDDFGSTAFCNDAQGATP